MILWHTYFSYGKTARSLSDEHLTELSYATVKTADWLTGGDPEGVKGDEWSLLAWSGYEYALCIYGMFVGMEVTRRGYADKTFWQLREIIADIGGSYEAPPWVKDQEIARSHRAALTRLHPGAYRGTWGVVKKSLPLLHPVITFDDQDNPTGYQIEKETP